jgi:mRNA interferase RelE/StbE
MTYSLKIKSSALKEIRALPGAERARVVAAIDSLPERPHRGTQLKGELTGMRRLRVGRYRIIYEVQDRCLVVLVLRVGHRRDVYR